MRVDVLGVRFDNITIGEAVSRAMELIKAPAPSEAVTPNSEIVWEARKNPELMRVLNSSELVLPDGIGIIYASKILGSPIAGRVPGIEFAEALMAELARSDIPLYLLGSKPGVADAAAEKLKARFPGLIVCGTADGYFKDNALAASRVRESGARVVFVCLGAPKQELWISEYGKSTGASLLVGLGGCLDVFSGAVARAPAFWRKMGLEWLYRLIKEPKRIGRMSRLPLFLFKAVGTRIKNGRAR